MESVTFLITMTSSGLLGMSFEVIFAIRSASIYVVPSSKLLCSYTAAVILAFALMFARGFNTAFELGKFCKITMNYAADCEDAKS